MSHPDDRLAPRPDDDDRQRRGDPRSRYDDDDRPRRRRDRDYPPPKSNTAIVVVCVLVGLLVVGGIIAALIFPAISKVRHAAARAQSQNNLKQLTIGIHNIANTYGGKIPPSVGQFPDEGPNSPNASLYFHLLPHVEQDFIYQQYQFQPTQVPSTIAVKTYIAPGDASNTGGQALTSYASNAALFGLKNGGQDNFPLMMKKGSGSTAMFMERSGLAMGKQHFWFSIGDRDTYLYPPGRGVVGGMEPPDESEFTPPVFDVKPESANPNAPHGFVGEVINVALGDGSVRAVSRKEMSPHLWAWLCSVDGPLTDEIPPPGW